MKLTIIKGEETIFEEEVNTDLSPTDTVNKKLKELETDMLVSVTTIFKQGTQVFVITDDEEEDVAIEQTIIKIE